MESRSLGPLALAGRYEASLLCRVGNLGTMFYTMYP